MIMSSILNVVKSVVGSIAGIVDKRVKDKDLALKLKHELESTLLNRLTTEMEIKRDVIVAEAQGESWLQRNWRPILMLSFTAIIVNNYILSPYLQAMFGFSVSLDIPNNMWDLLTVGIGGYIAGRTGEKIMTKYKGGN